ncbi:CPBP family intramembrane glutamic endopeptidase [Huintestinicola sp.]|uniref:CPBP family intramembrane glutamic endopeptidase n=1 Tax=Huintestinicola sp. TaxID=2981661 RepID=UPI003D7EB05C
MAITRKRDNSDSRIASLKLQDKEYNELYRKWRIEHKKDYGFYFLDNSDELTYRDGEGFITESPQAAERTVIVEIHSLLAKFLSIYTVLNLMIWLIKDVAPFGDIPLLYNLLRFVSSSEYVAVATDYIVKISVRLLPLIYLLRKINMPKKLLMPVKIYNKPLFNIAVPMAMLTFGIATVLSNIQHTSAALLGVDPNYSIWIPQNKVCLVLSAVLTAVIVPLISEIVHHGIILQILKQFGDGYALIVTSLIAALTAGNYHTFLFTFTIMLVVGFFVVRSGSIVTGFVMRIVISGSVYFLTLLKSVQLPEGLYMSITAALLFVYITIGFTAVSVFIMRYSNKISLPLYQMYLSTKERIMCCLTNASVIMWLTLTVMLMIIDIKWL